MDSRVNDEGPPFLFFGNDGLFVKIIAICCLLLGCITNYYLVKPVLMAIKVTIRNDKVSNTKLPRSAYAQLLKGCGSEFPSSQV